MPIETTSPAQSLLDSLANEPGLQHELAFYATFAHKTFLLMQREGPKAEGFGKLQQTFRDTVQQVRTILAHARDNGHTYSEEFLEVSPAGMAKLMDLMQELAKIKQSKL